MNEQLIQYKLVLNTYKALSTPDMIKSVMDEGQLTPNYLAKQLGYSDASMISLLRSGMRPLPASKAARADLGVISLRAKELVKMRKKVPELANSLKVWRNGSPYNQSQLARVCGCSNSSYAKIERGDVATFESYIDGVVDIYSLTPLVNAWRECLAEASKVCTARNCKLARGKVFRRTFCKTLGVTSQMVYLYEQPKLVKHNEVTVEGRILHCLRFKSVDTKMGKRLYRAAKVYDKARKKCLKAIK